jgi:Rhodanese-like domain
VEDHGMKLIASTRPGPLLAAAALAFLAAPPRAAAAEPELPMLSVEEVSKLVGAKDVTILDANTPEVYERGHLPGAIFVDSATLLARLPRDTSRRLVFYCKNTH